MAQSPIVAISTLDEVLTTVDGKHAQLSSMKLYCQCNEAGRPLGESQIMGWSPYVHGVGCFVRVSPFLQHLSNLCKLVDNSGLAKPVHVRIVRHSAEISTPVEVLLSPQMIEDAAGAIVAVKEPLWISIDAQVAGVRKDRVGHILHRNQAMTLYECAVGLVYLGIQVQRSVDFHHQIVASPPTVQEMADSC